MANEELLLKLKKLHEATGAPTVPVTPPASTDINARLKALQEADTAKAMGTPDGASPYDTWGGTLTQIGKVLGSGLEQAGTSIAGMPAALADTTKAGVEMLPEWAQAPAMTAARVLNPALTASMAARDAGIAPSSGEMDQYLQDKGLQYKPEPGSLEDWAQYLTSVAAQGAVPVGQSATLANAGKGALMSLLPGAAAKGASEATSTFTDSPMAQTAAGVGASILAALIQHKGLKLAYPEVDVAKQLGDDIGASERATLEEYKRLGVPAMAADIVPPNSTSSAAIRDAVQTNPNGKAQYLLDELANREKSAGTRIQSSVTAATGADTTAAQHIANIEKQADDIAKPIHTDVRVSDLYSNNSKAVRDVIPYLRPGGDIPDPVAKVMETVKGYLTKTNEAGVPSPHLEARGAFAAREYIRNIVAKNPEMEAYLKPIFKKLNGALTLSHPEITKADNAIALRDARVSAVTSGKKAASGVMDPKDVAAEFEALGKLPNGAQLQQDYQLGYGSTLKTRVGNTKAGTSGVTAVNSKAQGEKMSTLLGPDETQRRDFEMTAVDTKNRYTTTPTQRPGLIERIRHLPGHGFNALSMASAVPLTVAGMAGQSTLGMALGGLSGTMGLVGLLREPAAARAWLKAAGIKDPKELEKFLLSGKELGTYAGKAGKAGIINALAGYGR